MQAVEVLKEIMEIGRSLSGELLLYDAMDATVDRFRLRRRKECNAECVHAGPRAI
jgi:hypothetical protein